MKGYNFNGTTATTYLGTSNVACATGYVGVVNPTKVTCDDTGKWTAVNGCIIIGKIYCFCFLKNKG